MMTERNRIEEVFGLSLGIYRLVLRRGIGNTFGRYVLRLLSGREEFERCYLIRRELLIL
jgi:hypothetical protein